MSLLPPLAVDGYKIDHRRQLPPDVYRIHSNITPRKSRIPNVNEVVVYGVQHYIMDTLIKWWDECFFKMPIEEITEKFYKRMLSYTGSKKFADDIGVAHWKALHELGYLPLSIRALPEGSLCPIGVPFATFDSTYHEFAWFVQYIETDMSAEIWGPVTSATTAREFKKIFTKWADITGGDPGFVQFQGHDFSYRGMFGRQAAMLSGSAHLTSFVGTDTLPAIDFLDEFYDANSYNDLVGCSVFATEHAVMCITTGYYILTKDLTWERYGDAEYAVFERLITEVYPTGIVSVVSDTWNLWKVLLEYLPKLKEKVLKRDGKLVIRPDSGDPVKIIAGYTPYDVYKKEGMYKKNVEELQPVEKGGVVEALWNIFGGEYTKKGYRVLDPHIGCIYGDSITLDRAEEICKRLADKKFASTNWVAGIGSYTYQYVTRDTFGMAMKATYAEIALCKPHNCPAKDVGCGEPDCTGEMVIHGIEIFKDPITDDGTKKSARGLLRVVKKDGKRVLEQQCTQADLDAPENELKEVFRDGKLLIKQTLKQIRQRIDESITEQHRNAA